MIKLAPSILAADCANLEHEMKMVEAAGASYLHIDVMDGHFVPTLFFGMRMLESLRKVSDMIFDVHLMITDPERYIEDFAKCGADIITFHIEACNDAQETRETIDRIHAFGCKAGISIKPQTPVDVLAPWLDMVEMVLIMTVEPGFGGQQYLDECTEKIVKMRSMINERNLPVDLEVDGGIGKENIRLVAEAGANVIVAGSAIFSGDAQDNIHEMMHLV